MPAMKKKPERIGVGKIFDKLLQEIGNQVEFELPDWFNKLKPVPYTYIKRNIYLTKKVKRRLEDDGIFCSCNSPVDFPSVCSRDCHCGCMIPLWWRNKLVPLIYILSLTKTYRTLKRMLLSSCSSACKCNSSCLNKPFHQRPTKKMKLVKTEKCGSGIVADEDIKHGEFIIEYVGEVIDDKTCEERLWKMKHQGETNFYLCEINRDMVIDATYKGNKSRYINHSCSPNTEMQKWRIEGETRIGIFATRDIRRGEHLTYDYQFVQFGADQDCHCGAVGCRQKLGVNSNKSKTASSDAALKIVACQVAVTSPKVKAILFRKHVYQNEAVHTGCLGHDINQPKRPPHNCIGEVIRMVHSIDRRSFGIVKRFDNTTRKHLIMFEDGDFEFVDMSKEDWEICNY